MKDNWLSWLWDPASHSLINVFSIFDILLVTFLIYRLLKLVRGSRAWRVVIGIFVFVLALNLSDRLHLYTLHWILDKASLLAPVALVILLLPELRQALEGFARVGFWPGQFLFGNTRMASSTIEEVVKAATELSEKRTGALMVLERANLLDDVAQNGVTIRALVSAPLLVTLFQEGNPLHDGAAVIRGDQVVAAACRLPLSESTTLDRRMHMRHRAAAGISEQSDCLVVVISEERGKVSVAEEGKVETMESIQDLRGRLNQSMSGGQLNRKSKEREEAALP